MPREIVDEWEHVDGEELPDGLSRREVDGGWLYIYVLREGEAKQVQLQYVPEPSAWGKALSAAFSLRG